MLRRCNLMIERFEAWWKIAYKSLRLCVKNVEKDGCVGSIFGNQFHLLLMFSLQDKCGIFVVSRNPLQTMIKSLNNSHVSVCLTYHNALG
jgi:hypothetical protein